MTNRKSKWQGRAIIHLDLDAFFASVAQLDNPDLRGKPVIIGSNTKRGVVSTCSYEARVFGVRSAMSSVMANRLCPEGIWVSPAFDRYHELSNQVFDILRSYTPNVLPVSIDEAFADITPDSFTGKDPIDVALDIQRGISETGITCSIGLASNMTCAKIGSDYQKPRGLTFIKPGQEAQFLAPLSIRVLSGIGPATAAKLDELHIGTLGDLAQLTTREAEMILGSLGPELKNRAAGIDPRAVVVHEPVKSVSNENTYAQDLRTHYEVEYALRALVDKVSGRLREQGLAGRTITLKIRTSDWTTKTSAKTVDYSCDDQAQILPVVLALLPKVWTEGQGIRLLGVAISNFDKQEEQLGLFDKADSSDQDAIEQSKRLSSKIDSIRAKFGDGSIKRGL